MHIVIKWMEMRFYDVRDIFCKLLRMILALCNFVKSLIFPNDVICIVFPWLYFWVSFYQFYLLRLNLTMVSSIAVPFSKTIDFDAEDRPHLRSEGLRTFPFCSLF